MTVSNVELCTHYHVTGHPPKFNFVCKDSNCGFYGLHVNKEHKHGLKSESVCTVPTCIFFQTDIGEDHIHRVKIADGEDVYFQTKPIGSEGRNSYRKPIAVRYDLIPVCALEQLAQVYEEGAQVYGDAKYIEKPLPFSSIINHAFNHLVKLISGDRTELHAAKVMWAMASLINLEELQKDGLLTGVDLLNDVSKYGSGAQAALQKRLDARGHTHGQDNKAATVYTEDRKTESSNQNDDSTRSSETVFDLSSGPSSSGFN